jgi:hypothetical protein
MKKICWQQSLTIGIGTVHNLEKERGFALMDDRPRKLAVVPWYVPTKYVHTEKFTIAPIRWILTGLKNVSTVKKLPKLLRAQQENMWRMIAVIKK